MIYLKRYNENDLYMAPSGAIMDAAAVLKQWPAVSHFAHVVQTDASGEMMYGFYNLSAMRGQYGIDPSLDPDAAAAALEAAMNAEQEAQAEAAANAVSVEERTAAALELLAISSLPDET